MSRIDLGIDREEAAAAVAVNGLADLIQTICYYKNADGIPPATVKALHRAYRVLKSAACFYFGDESGLLWDPPDYKFKKAEKC